MSNTHDSDVLILGGGISGLSLAHHCAASGQSVRILEGGDTPGGCLHSAQTSDGFWFEMGAHTCYNSYGGLIDLIEAVGLRERLLPRAKAPFRLLVDGEVRSVASQLGIFELLGSVPRLIGLAKEGRTVRDYYGRIVGSGNYERVFGPLFAAVPSQNADAFPASMLFKKRDRRKDVLRSFTVQGGLQTIALGLAAQPTVDLVRGARAVSVAHRGAGFEVTTQDGRTFGARRLAFAVPPSEAARLCANVAPALSQALGSLRTTAIRSFGLAVARTATSAPVMAGLIPLKGPFFSAVTRDTVPDADWRGFAFHWPGDTAEDQAVEVACRVLRIEPKDIRHLARRDVVLPSPVLGHGETVKAIDAALQGTQLAVTGNYFDGLAIEDCVQRSRAEASRWAATS